MASPPPYPFLKLNTDGSTLDNPGLARAGGVLQDCQEQWIARFLMHVGLATNNMVELEAVRQGLAMARNMGVKSLQLELDSKVVLNWLTNSNLNYPTNILPLICDCRNGKCTCNTCSVRQMAVQMLWQSGGPISEIG